MPSDDPSSVITLLEATYSEAAAFVAEIEATIETILNVDTHAHMKDLMEAKEKLKLSLANSGSKCRSELDARLAARTARGGGGRGLHTSTFQLNLSRFLL